MQPCFYFGALGITGGYATQNKCQLILLSVLFSVLFLSPFYFSARGVDGGKAGGNFVDGG